MSWRASAYVIDTLARKHDWLSLSHIAVLLAIAARHHQDDHCAWGQLQRLSEDTHASVGTLSRLIGELEAGEVLAVWDGYLPKRKGEPEDARRRRSLLFTFPGLDADEGPPYDNVQRHVRRGGAGMHAVNGSVDESASDFSDHQPESVAPDASEAEPVESDQLQPVASPHLHHAQLLNVLLPAGIPDTTRSVVIPVSPAGTRARAPDEAAPRRAAEDDSPDNCPDQGIPPKWQEVAPGQFRGRPGGQGEVTLLKARCSLCERSFVLVDHPDGPLAADDHECVEHHECAPIGQKLHPRPEPGNLAGFLPRRRPRGGVPPEVQAELDAMAAERSAYTPPSDLVAEHERRLAAARSGDAST